jgi:hypothetical protein
MPSAAQRISDTKNGFAMLLNWIQVWRLIREDTMLYGMRDSTFLQRVNDKKDSSVAITVLQER